MQQHKELALTYEENISILEAHNTLSIPQTTRTGSAIMGNQTYVKLNMYCTNCHYINHNVETYKSTKEEPTVTTTKAIAQVGKLPRPLNYPYHICGIMGHKLTNSTRFGKMQNMFKDKRGKTT